MGLSGWATCLSFLIIVFLWGWMSSCQMPNSSRVRQWILNDSSQHNQSINLSINSMHAMQRYFVWSERTFRWVEVCSKFTMYQYTGRVIMFFGQSCKCFAFLLYPSQEIQPLSANIPVYPSLEVLNSCDEKVCSFWGGGHPRLMCNVLLKMHNFCACTSEPYSSVLLRLWSSGAIRAMLYFEPLFTGQTDKTLHIYVDKRETIFCNRTKQCYGWILNMKTIWGNTQLVKR